MTITEAIRQRIPRVRLPQWGNPNAYLRLPLFPAGTSGPWAELYDDVTQESVLAVRPGSQRLLVMGFSGADGYVPYEGPRSPFEDHPDNFSRAYTES